MARAVSGINADVRAALDARADLGTILPLVFAAAGVAQVGARGAMPVPTWFNLLWWSLRSFMTFNFEAVTEEEGQPAQAEGARRDAMGGISGARRRSRTADAAPVLHLGSMLGAARPT